MHDFFPRRIAIRLQDKKINTISQACITKDADVINTVQGYISQIENQTAAERKQCWVAHRQHLLDDHSHPAWPGCIVCRLPYIRYAWRIYVADLADSLILKSHDRAGIPASNYLSVFY